MSDLPTTESVAARVLELLASRGETLATAESLTGGMVGERVTDVPGASRVYLGGVITYATRLKATLAGVPEQTLAELGPVAARTAEQMALGVARRCGAHWGLSTTGVAGPDSQDGHPVGQVFIGVARPVGALTQVTELRLRGSREQVRAAAAEGALELLLQMVGNDE